MLSREDWYDIKYLGANRLEGSDVSTEERWSPRAELSGARLLSSDESMESPEQVMKRMKAEAGIDEVDWAYDSRRRSGSSSSQSMIFSPILVKPGGDIVNVSSSSSALNTSRGSGRRLSGRSSTGATRGTMFSTMESAETLPMSSLNPQGSGVEPMPTAMAMWRMGWGSAACSTQFMSWAHEDYYKSFIDDLNQAKNGEMAVVKEEEENDADDDVFDMSQVE